MPASVLHAFRSRVAEADEAADVRPLAGRAILVVDDCGDARRLLTYVLKRAGARVAVAVDGPAALTAVRDAAAGTRFDVVLCDYEMPGWDGIETTRRLRAAGFEGTLIAMSGVASADALWAWIEADCDSFFPKPFASVDVLDAVGRGMELAYGRKARKRMAEAAARRAETEDGGRSPESPAASSPTGRPADMLGVV